MRVRLAYGSRGLEIDVPEDATVVRPVMAPALAAEGEAVVEALRRPAGARPLAELARSSSRAVVVFPDLTRPMPNRTVLPPILSELERAGMGPDRVELLCATGTHRRATPREMHDLIGPDLVSRYRVHDHQSGDPDHLVVGEVGGIPVALDQRYVEADLRVVTGFVEPHFFAGFSGGPKGVCPGLASTSTILEAHAPERISDPRATWTVLDGNPVHEFVRAAVALCPPSLSVDVTINDDRRLTGVFCGPLPDSHRRACQQVEQTVVQAVDGPFDVVVSTNGGYPLDRNLYQAVKGMAAAERVVRPGGTIVMAAACDDGVPSGGAFSSILAESRCPEDLIGRQDPDGNPPSGTPAERPAPRQLDRWQAQVMGRVLAKARVAFHTRGIDADELGRAQLTPVADLSAEVERLVLEDRTRRWCVLPQGPLTVASLA